MRRSKCLMLGWFIAIFAGLPSGRALAQWPEHSSQTVDIYISGSPTGYDWPHTLTWQDGDGTYGYWETTGEGERYMTLNFQVHGNTTEWWIYVDDGDDNYDYWDLPTIPLGYVPGDDPDWEGSGYADYWGAWDGNLGVDQGDYWLDNLDWGD